MHLSSHSLFDFLVCLPCRKLISSSGGKNGETHCQNLILIKNPASPDTVKLEKHNNIKGL